MQNQAKEEIMEFSVSAEKYFDSRFDNQEKYIVARFEKVDIKLDGLDTKINFKFEMLDKKIDALNEKINFNTKLTLGFLSIMLTIIIALHFIR